jgi:hypothetical protein
MQLPLFELQLPVRYRKLTSASNGRTEKLPPPAPQPQIILQKVLEVLGGIDLDVYSTMPDLPAKARFLPQDKGLTHAWRGRVWLSNVPGRALDKWIDKLCAEYEHGEVLAAMALLPARFNTPWWPKLATLPFCAIQGRIEVVKPDGSKGKLTTPSAVVYWGPQLTRFATVFAKLGTIYIPYS